MRITPDIEPFYKRAALLLEDGDFSRAGEYCKRILDMAPDYAPAYILKLCAELKVRNEADLANHIKPLDDMPDYQRTLNLAASDYRARLEGYNDTIKKRAAKKANRARVIKKIAIYICAAAAAASVVIAAVGAWIYFSADDTVVAAGSDDGQLNADRNLGLEGLEKAEERAEAPISAEKTALSRRLSHTLAVGGTGGITDVNDGVHIVRLREDGTVYAVGNNNNGQCDVSDWRDITAVAAGNDFSIGLRRDGTLVAAGSYYDGSKIDVSGWKDITAVAMGYDYSIGDFAVGLRGDGTVVTAGGSTYDGAELEGYNVSGWRNITAVAAGFGQIIGLRADGTLVATYEEDLDDVSDWRGIVAISTATEGEIAGLRADGTVVTAGNANVSGWRDIVAVASGPGYVAGLRGDGTVAVAGAGWAPAGWAFPGVSDWRNIGALVAGDYPIGLRADGTVITNGYGYEAYTRYARDISDWNILTAKPEQRVWLASINGDSVRIRSEPATADNNNIVHRANNGDSSPILEERRISQNELWYLVEYQPGKQGWVRSDLVNVQ